jgi:IPT/TIG domain
MPVRTGGTFLVKIEDVGVSLAGFTRNVVEFYPYGGSPTQNAYYLGASGAGSVVFGISDASLVETSAHGTFLPSAAPAGFHPTTGLRAAIDGEATLNGVSDVLSFGPYLFPVVVATGPGLQISTWYYNIPDYRSWALLSTDLFEAHGVTPGFTSRIMLHAHVVPNGGTGASQYGLFLQGNYDIAIYWWRLPDKTACGEARTSRLVYATDQPGPDYERFDPDDPDAAPTPTIVLLTPDHGPVAGGTPCVLEGSGFGDDATVTVDGLDATDVVVVSQYRITYAAPAHAAGAAAVVVTNPDGVSSV